MATANKNVRPQRLDLPVRWRGALIIAIPVTCLVTSVASFALLQKNTEVAQKYVNHSQKVIFESNRLLTVLVEAETSVRGYELTRKVEFLKPYKDAIATLPGSLKRLKSLLNNQPDRIIRYKRIQTLVEQEMGLLKRSIDIVKPLKPTDKASLEQLKLPLKAKTTMDAIREQIGDFTKQQELVLNAYNQRLDDQRQITAAVIASTATIGFVGSLAAIYLFDRLDRQLEERQQRLEESNVRLQAILDNVVDGIITVNQNGHIQSFNQAAQLMFGYEPQEVIGKNLNVLIANYAGGNSVETLNYFIGDGKIRIPAVKETIGLRKNGQMFPMELAFSQMQLDNQNVYIAIMRDLSDRKKSEEILRSQAQLLDLANDTIIVRDRQDRITYWNLGAVRLYGWTKEEAIGQSVRTLLKTEFPQPLFEIQEFLLAQGYWRGELVLTKRDGTRIIVASRWTLQVDDEGEPLATLEISNDITERKAAEQALRDRAGELAHLSAILAHTNAALEKRNQELDQFAYIVSHDLKAPLRAISNLSSWIEEDIQDCLQSETKHQMELLRGRVFRMEALINGILQYSRVGRLKTPVETVDVSKLLAEVIDSLGPSPTFTIAVTSPMPILTTERLPLEQVFANLISNAIKHHNRSDGVVTISAQDQGNFYEFAVSDDGPGIDLEYHHKIFVIFQTLSARDRVENTGIGLSIVKKIVENQGGTIRVESKEGQGATFYFTWYK